MSSNVESNTQASQGEKSVTYTPARMDNTTEREEKTTAGFESDFRAPAEVLQTLERELKRMQDEQLREELLIRKKNNESFQRLLPMTVWSPPLCFQILWTNRRLSGNRCRELQMMTGSSALL